MLFNLKPLIILYLKLLGTYYAAWKESVSIDKSRRHHIIITARQRYFRASPKVTTRQRPFQRPPYIAKPTITNNPKKYIKIKYYMGCMPMKTIYVF